MDIPISHAEMRQEIMRYMITGAASVLPDTTQRELVKANLESSWVVSYAITVEALWAVRDLLDAAGMTLLGKLAGFMALPENDFMEMGRSGRGAAMRVAMQRDLGEPANGSPWPDRSHDPDVAPQYRPAPEPGEIPDQPAD